MPATAGRRRSGWRTGRRRPRRNGGAGRARAGCRRRPCAPTTSRALRRGSITAYSMSTRKLMATTIAASSTTRSRTTTTSAVGDGLQDQPADAGQGEDVLDHDGPGQEVGELQPHDGEDGNHGVAQHVPPQGGAPGQALGAGGADIVLAHRVEQRGAGETREDRALDRGQRDGRQDQRRQRRPRSPRPSRESRRPKTSAD